MPAATESPKQSHFKLVFMSLYMLMGAVKGQGKHLSKVKTTKCAHLNFTQEHFAMLTHMRP